MSRPRPLIFQVINASPASLGVSKNAKAVLVRLLNAYNPEKNGRMVWPGVDTIADSTGLSRREVQRRLRELEGGDARTGVDLIKAHERSGGRVSTRYLLNVDLIAALTAADSTATSGRGCPVDNSPTATQCHPNCDTVSPLPRHSVARIAKEQPTGTARDFSPFGCSTSLRVRDGDQQRKMALHGLVAETAQRISTTSREQPTREEPEMQQARPARGGQ